MARKRRKPSRRRKPTQKKKTGCKRITMKNGQTRYGCFTRGRFRFVSYATYNRRK